MTSLHRRAFLGGAAAGAALLVTNTSAPRRRAKVGFSTPTDPRVGALVDLSRDDDGRPHVARAAFLSPDGAAGSLDVSAEEHAELRSAFASHDFRAFRERGVVVGGRKFVFIREAEAGAVLHAVQRGELLTVRATDRELILATSGKGMAHGRAVEAVHQFVRRTAAVA